MEIPKYITDMATIAAAGATVIAAVMTAISAAGTAISALFLYLTNKQSERAQKAQVFLEISKQYNEVYYKRNQLLKAGRLWPAYGGCRSPIVQHLYPLKLFQIL